MLLVFGLAALIWFGGGLAGLPRQARGLMLGLLYVAVLMVQVALPEGHPLRLATGGSPAVWLILGGFGALATAYALGVRRLKGRAAAKEAAEAPAPRPGAMAEAELERYARHIVLRELGGPGQRALREAKVLVVGAGGLGAPALQYLAAAGVGTVGVIDQDRVENANLQRQVIHRDADIGIPKVFSAQAAMEAQNPYVTVRPYNRRLTEEIADALFADYDVILDGSDNFETRELVNRAAVAAGRPLVWGALTQWEGQLAVFDPARGGPCYACVFPERPAPGLAPACAEAGVLGPLPGVVGAMMAVEAIKLIAQAGQPLTGRLMLYDALYAEARVIAVARRPGCPVCGAGDGALKA
ncbi:molybdopterin biosynthesis protein [Rhodosalinus halophilus]|uniref:Molybdopterin-synthase adenylyltransferase n=1 Tax=Rhodosalinus halophilus TaxID=2259333 RepID=A0A365UD33_9RHOB|nr:molybdopterin-synthase adenylyltransferase MoeB [Rhodosalinus halophilus]RBI87163.1 molybdopterin biosynthesis protein [Rhodosalinus halophilus]